MKVLNSGLQDDIFHKAYGEFSRLCLTPGTDIGVAKDSFVRTRNLFIRKHRKEEFYDRTCELSEKLKEKGNTSLSSLFVSEMLERRKPENAIKLYQKAKNIYEELGREQ